jgi:nitrogen fixation protein FixH
VAIVNNLVLSLILGSGLVVAVSLLLDRFSALGAVRAALVGVLAAFSGYVPFAILHWPGGDVLAVHLAVYLLTGFGCGLWLRQREQGGDQPQAGRLHWGPLLITGFFAFLVVLNAVFIILAERGLPPALSGYLLPPGDGRGEAVHSAFPGIASHDFQEKEALYNDYLQQVARQQARGWQIRKGWLGTPVQGEPATFQVAATTRDGEPLTAAEVQGRFLRPADSRLDTAFAMREVSAGVYQVSLALPAAGTWNLVLELSKGDDRHEIRASTAVAGR